MAGANDLAVTGRGNLKPRFQVRVGPGGRLQVGANPTLVVTFPISANVMKSNSFSADRFKIVCALYADPNQSNSFWAPAGEGDGGLGDGINVGVDVMFEGYPGFSNWIEVFRGATDKVKIDTHKGVVTLTGRNFYSLLLDAQNPENVDDTPIHQVVTNYAKRHGLTVDFGHAGPPGDHYGQEVQGAKNHITGADNFRDLGELDVISSMAKFEGRTVIEDKGVLYMVKDDGVNVNIWDCQAPTPEFIGAFGPGIGHITKLGPSNSIGLTFTHDFHYTFNTQTVVVNTKPNVGGADTAAYAAKYPEHDPNSDPIERHNMIHVNGMTDADSDKLAKNIHIVSNFREWVMEWKLAGPDLLRAKVTDIVNVINVDNSFIHGAYIINSIEYDISFDRGFVQIIKGVWGRTEQLG